MTTLVERGQVITLVTEAISAGEWSGLAFCYSRVAGLSMSVRLCGVLSALRAVY